VRSRVELGADVGDDGRPVLVRALADGQFAVRATGPGQVHLVGTAAGPLGGDELDVVVRVRPGATLAVRGVAASLALPGRSDAPGRVVTTLEVGEGARLDYTPSPLIMCRGARLTTVTTLVAAGTAVVDLTEAVVLGRHGEAGGDWSGRLVADRAGFPVLRTTQASALVASARPDGAAPARRAVLTRLLLGGGLDHSTASVHGAAVRCPLAAGATLVTALGAGLTEAEREVAALLPDLLPAAPPATAAGAGRARAPRPTAGGLSQRPPAAGVQAF